MYTPCTICTKKVAGHFNYQRVQLCANIHFARLVWWRNILLPILSAQFMNKYIICSQKISMNGLKLVYYMISYLSYVYKPLHGKVLAMKSFLAYFNVYCSFHGLPDAFKLTTSVYVFKQSYV